MRPGFFVRFFFASFFDLKAKHLPSFFTSTAAAEQPRRGHLGLLGALRAAPWSLLAGRLRVLEPSDGSSEPLGGQTNRIEEKMERRERTERKEKGEKRRGEEKRGGRGGRRR